MRTAARSRTSKPFWHMLLWPDSRAALRASSVLDVSCSRQSQFPPDVLHHHETRDPHFQHMLGTSTRSGFRRGCGRASRRPPSDLVDQVHVSGALSGARTGKGPRWQTHAQRRNLGISVRPGQPGPTATCPANARYFQAIWFPSRLRPSKLAPTLRPC